MVSTPETTLPSIAPHQPLVPGWAGWVAAGLAGLLGLVAAMPFIPPPFNGLCGILAFIAATLGGLSAAPPSLTSSKPVVPLTLVPTLGSLAAVAADIASSLPDGWPHRLLYFGALILAWLTGKVLPTPTMAAPAP